MATKYIIKHRRGTTEQWEGTDEIIYDGGGVSLDEEDIEVIVDGTKNN